MNVLSDLNRMLDKPNITVIITLILTLYSGLAAPALPNQVIEFFDTFPGRILFIFLIGFTASKNIQVALMIAVAFVVTLHILNQRSIEQYKSFKYLEQFQSGNKKWNCSDCKLSDTKKEESDEDSKDEPEDSEQTEQEAVEDDGENDNEEEAFIDFNEGPSEAYMDEDEAVS